MVDRAPVNRPGLVGDLRARRITYIVVTHVSGAGLGLFPERPRKSLQGLAVTGKRPLAAGKAVFLLPFRRGPSGQVQAVSSIVQEREGPAVVGKQL
jgi:hypothetical protein